jgi:hypothetical protein
MALSIFFAIAGLGGLIEAKDFLESSENFIKVYSRFLIESAESIMISFTRNCLTFIDITIMEIANFSLKIVEGCSKSISLEGFCCIAVFTIIIGGWIRDPERMRLVCSDFYIILGDATTAVWKVVSQPYNLLGYAILYFLVKDIPNLISAIQTTKNCKFENGEM